MMCPFRLNPGVLAALLTVSVYLVEGMASSAQVGGSYELSWSTIDSGGTEQSKSATRRLEGTAGQPATVLMSAGGFELEGGLWAALPYPGVFGDRFETGDFSAWSKTVGASPAASPTDVDSAPLQEDNSNQENNS